MSEDAAIRALLVGGLVVAMVCHFLWETYVNGPREERRRAERQEQEREWAATQYGAGEDERDALDEDEEDEYAEVYEEPYGEHHWELRSEYAAIIRSHGGYCVERVCIMATRRIERGAPWHLAHDHDRGGSRDYLGPAHPECNQAEALRRGVTWDGAPSLSELLESVRARHGQADETEAGVVDPWGDDRRGGGDDGGPPAPLASGHFIQPHDSDRAHAVIVSGMPPPGADSYALEELRDQFVELTQSGTLDEVAAFRVSLGSDDPGDVWLDASDPAPNLLPLAAVSAACSVARTLSKAGLDDTAREWLHEFANAGSSSGLVEWLADPASDESVTVAAIVYRDQDDEDRVLFNSPTIGATSRALAALWAASERVGQGNTVRRALALLAAMSRADLTSAAIVTRVPGRLVRTARQPSPYGEEEGVDAQITMMFKAQGILDGLIHEDADRALRAATHSQVSADWQAVVTVAPAQYETHAAFFYGEFGLGIIVSTSTTSARGSRTVTNDCGESDTAWGVDMDEMLITGDLLDGWAYDHLDDVFTHVIGHMPPRTVVSMITVQGGGYASNGLRNSALEDGGAIPGDPELRAAVLATLLHAADAFFRDHPADHGSAVT
ncbi:hypothetical protein KUV85_13430 [Nocardioides panacisoli]|uniref:hypothetical protein n=1 Tax=Nocardioides panacisoli TaxID=627624 RepID=UPI001C630B78|nr:hypothetical protein [Nocardioides panacisoli]QYJ03324.1 hypothetical protein KUV85_13430 [Nocardioides panacisoli]